mmetsp:Transcript_71535/g.220815  ORF Transcript_71535/g.220815 Transcript_71535/m.220815 type:complete len:479 (-) Transcript_71535:568-2004(-)
MHLGDAHRLQCLDGREARYLVLDALDKRRQAALQGGLELWQVARAHHEMTKALQSTFFHLLIYVRGHELPAQHLKHRQHFHKLGAGLLRSRPERIDEGTHSAESLRYGLVVGVVAALQEQRAHQGRQRLIDLGGGVVLAEVPHADEGVQPHAGVALLHGSDQLVLDLRKVWLDVLRHALRKHAEQRQGALPGLRRLRPQLLVQLRHALRQHSNEGLSRRSLLGRWRPLHLQDAHWLISTGTRRRSDHGLVLDDRGLSHLCERREHIQLHALLALREAGNQRSRKRRVDILQLVRQAPHHRGKYLQGSAPHLPGVVIIVRVDKPVIIEFIKAIVHGVVCCVTRVVEVWIVRNQVKDHVTQLVQMRGHLLGATQHEGFECIQAVLDYLVVLLVVTIHGDVLLSGLVDNVEKQRRNLAEMLTDAEADIPADRADALDVLLLLRLCRSRTHVGEQHLHEGIQLSVSKHRRECPNTSNHLLSE